MKTLVIDANSILNRAFYGVRPLTSPDGRRTEAVYGALNMIARQLGTNNFDIIAAAFDVHAPTFRHKADSTYKAGRHPTPPELLSQFPLFKDALEKLGIAVVECEGYEADDIIGTIADYTAKNGDEAYILTGDRDSLQLIKENVTVLLCGNSDTVAYDIEKFKEKYGITPDKYVFVKALMGDSSDNISGVPGIGEKTAFKLILDNGSLDNIYENLDNLALSAGVKAKLSDGKDKAYHSLFLATIVKDAPICKEALRPVREAENKNEARKLFASLGFKSLIPRFALESSEKRNGEEGKEKKETKDKADIDNENRDKQGDNSDVQTSLFDFGNESTKKQLKVYQSVTLDRIIAKEGFWDCVFSDNSLRVSIEGECFQVDFEDFSELSELFVKDKKICCFDTKQLYHRLAKIGIKDFDFAFDIMLGAYVLDSSEGDYSLSRIAAKYADAFYTDDDVLASDALVLTELRRNIDEKMRNEECDKLFYEIELPLAHLLCDMEEVGFKIDKSGLEEFSNKLIDASHEYEKKIYAIAGEEFNINSPKQLSAVLFEKLGLPVQKKTKSGYSTDAEVLEKLKPYSPIISLILDYRQVAKLNSTYAIGLREAADEQSRVHSVFKQTGTATGRLSSAEPNLQNIPIRTPLGREMRKYFLPEEGKLLLDADYSQIELRILAHISKDPTMINAFGSGIDIHAVTASQVFKVKIEDVTPEMRKSAKAVNFGIVYGIGEYSLSQDIGTSVAEAKRYIESYFETYPRIKEYMDECVAFATQNGYVKTLFNRRRYIPELSSGKAMTRAFGQRVARNSPIQGTAADIMKIAMINVWRGLKEAKIDARIILQVHDELVVESSIEDSKTASMILRNGMEKAFSGEVQMNAEVSVGQTWFDNK